MFKPDLIVRSTYSNAIAKLMGKRLVKIISGVRRSGKSYLLDMVADKCVENGIPKEKILYRLYTSIEIESGFDAKAMYEELKAFINSRPGCCLLLDEVQEIENWEQVVNTIFETTDADIYVTGSNSKLTSTNISSYLSGRYVTIPVYTLSYAEYLKFSGLEGSDESFGSYFRTGGFPVISISHLDYSSSYQIVEDIYHSIVTKDILSNHPIKNIDQFNRVVRFIMDNMGKTFSANSISVYFKSQMRTISAETIYNYIQWLEEAFIIYKCQRYDIKGKEILKTQEKYYLADPSIRFALFGYNSSMDDAILENIVFLDLKRRGFDVHVGKIGEAEIDFIASKTGSEVYIQVCKTLPVDSNREIDNLKSVNNHCHKYVVTYNRKDIQTVDGIEVIYISDFLHKTEL